MFVLILIFDTFLTPWLSRQVLGLQVLRVYPVSCWAVRLATLLLLTPPDRCQIRFPKCVFWEIHTGYKIHKSLGKLAFTRSVLRDMETLAAHFPKQSCFFGHTPMPVHRFVVLLKPGLIADIQGPFLSKTPTSRILTVAHEPTAWHAYLISV